MNSVIELVIKSVWFWMLSSYDDTEDRVIQFYFDYLYILYVSQVLILIYDRLDLAGANLTVITVDKIQSV